MHLRLIPFAAALALAGAATSNVSQQRATPSEAARTFSLDSVTPTPTDPASPSPTASATPSPTPSADAPTLPPPALPYSAAVSASPSPVPTEAPAPAETPAPAPSSAVRAVFTLDTPIQDLLADPGAKAVLDKDLPGVSDDENLNKFKALSLRAFQPMTGGQMTDAMLAKVAADLDVLAGGPGKATAPVKVGNTKRRNDDSR